MSIPGRRALFDVLEGRPLPRLRKRDLGPEELTVDHNGSWNIPVVSRAAKYAADGDVEWFLRYLQGQLRGPHGFMGKEFGSRLYSPAVVAAIETVAVFARRRNAGRLYDDCRRWLVNFYALAALAAEERVPARVGRRKRDDPSLPFTALTGMRTPSWFTLGSNLEPLLALARGAEELPAPYERAYHRGKVNAKWPVTLALKLRREFESPLEGRDEVLIDQLAKTHDVEAFLNLWTNPRMRNAFHVFRTHEGVCAWVDRNTNGNKGPLYALKATRSGIWGLHPDADRGGARAGKCYRYAGRLRCDANNKEEYLTLPQGSWTEIQVKDGEVDILEGS